MSTRLGVVGAGRAAAAIVASLRRDRSGIHLVGVLARDRRRAVRILGSAGKAVAFRGPVELLRASDVVVICVPDSAIAEVARTLARSAPPLPRVALHCSGALGTEPLRALARKGAATGSFHPLAALAPVRARAPLPGGIAVAVGGAARALREARRLARAVGARPFTLPDRARPAYHLAATILANHATVLARLASSMLDSQRATRGPFLSEAFARLLETVAERIRSEGPEQALTGPAARGDVITLRRHLARLQAERPRVRDLYVLLSLEALEIAGRRGDLPGPRLRAVRKALTRKGSGRR